MSLKPKDNETYLQRFLERTEVNGPFDCWGWKGPVDDKGYGVFRFYIDGKRITRNRAHTFAYLYFIGELTEGLDIDHKCGNRGCCNPLHLEKVTHQENVRRGRVNWMHKMKTHCSKGHEFSEENTYRYGKRGNSRACKICRADNLRKSRDNFKLRMIKNAS